MAQGDECGKFRCRGKIKKVKSLSGEVEYVCPKCGRKETKRGAKKE